MESSEMRGGIVLSPEQDTVPRGGTLRNLPSHLDSKIQH